VTAANSGRAKASVPPPAGKGTTMVTGRVGQLWARPSPDAASMQAARANAPKTCRLREMGGIGVSVFVSAVERAPGLAALAM
jgi:hypothetical protein